MSEEFGYQDDDDDVEYYAVRPNKTQQKKDLAALFALGEQLSELPPAQLHALALSDDLHKAIIEAAGLPPTGARKRQLKFIAGQLYKLDVQPILDRLARLQNQSAHAARQHHSAERWRDQLIEEGSEALAELLDAHPHADRQQLRQLIRNAQKERATGKPPKSSRLLYRSLRQLFEGDDAQESGEPLEAGPAVDD